MSVTNENDTPITANGDGPTPTADDTWQLWVDAEHRRLRQRMARQLRSVLRRLVAQEAYRLGHYDDVNANDITVDVLHPFVKAAVDEYQSGRRFEQLELKL